MSLPFSVTFDGVDTSEALREEILRRADKLMRLVPDAIEGAAIVERTEQRHHTGNRFGIRLRLSTPGHRFDVCRAGAGDPAHEDPLLAVRDAFDALRRQVDDHHAARVDGRRAPPVEAPESSA